MIDPPPRRVFFLHSKSVAAARLKAALHWSTVNDAWWCRSATTFSRAGDKTDSHEKCTRISAAGAERSDPTVTRCNTRHRRSPRSKATWFRALPEALFGTTPRDTSTNTHARARESFSDSSKSVGNERPCLHGNVLNGHRRTSCVDFATVGQQSPEGKQSPGDWVDPLSCPLTRKACLRTRR